MNIVWLRTWNSFKVLFVTKMTVQNLHQIIVHHYWYLIGCILYGYTFVCYVPYIRSMFFWVDFKICIHDMFPMKTLLNIIVFFFFEGMLNIIAIIYVFKFSTSLLIVSYLDYFKNAFRIFEFKIPNENYFFNHLTEIKRVAFIYNKYFTKSFMHIRRFIKDQLRV